jgi:ABC-2 type transport system ATP-binding protein
MTTSTAENAPVLMARDIHKAFRRETGEIVQALDAVSVEVRQGTLTALVGPDGAGKTTLLRLAVGLMDADQGELRVLGVDVAADPLQVQSRIGYMPQKFGLYEDLSVQENLDLYADMHGVAMARRSEQYPRLMEMTALGPFRGRLAGRLSGGMKQKLGLACTLVRAPELLLLDEPSVGVDPLSRRELWKIILQLVHEQRLTVLLSTSSLDDAERCDRTIVLHEGRVLADGPPRDVAALAAGRTYLVEPSPGQTARGLQSRLLDESTTIDAVPEGGRVRLVRSDDLQSGREAAVAGQSRFESSRANPLQADPPRILSSEVLSGATVVPAEPRFEDGFMVLLRQTAGKHLAVSGSMTLDRPPELHGGEAVVEVRELLRRFGAFTAVDQVSFEVRRGEIFGLLGPNGAGKTTTFRMVCGLLPATGGRLRVAGVDLRTARASARQRIGYVAQKFSLYGQLSVIENLRFFASAYGLRGARQRERIDWALGQFDLAPLARQASGQLPGGFKQRLAMAAALLHEPETLFLDEPTSGADPLARREFWRRITSLAEHGVTVIVTTHFMEEAEYCDRVVIMDAGSVLAEGTPAEVRRRARAEPGREPTMEDAFIAVVEEARHSAAGAANGSASGRRAARGGAA